MSDDALLGDSPELFGTPEDRVEGRLKVTGLAEYVGDLARPGMLWAAFRRSDVPHAWIRSLDASAARNLPGVHCVLTASDIGRARFGRRLLDQPVLAIDRVRFVGERIAAVAAETREAAEEAAQLVEVEYEDLPLVLDVDEALAPGAPILHDPATTYAYIGGQRLAVPHPNIQGRHVISTGAVDIESAFEGASRVFRHRFTTPRQHHGYIEPHASLVWIDGEEIVHVASTNKTPYLLREQMAAALGLPLESLDVDSGFIGGDFGGKGYSPDEYACYFLARATGRPVKATMSYVDELAAASHRHSARVDLRTGVDASGRFVAHEARVVFDGGAYASAKPLPDLVLKGGFNALAAYRIPNVAIEVLTVYTTTTPCGHMRAPGDVQALFAGESHIDAIAREIGHDPLQFRLLNAVRPGDVGAGEHQYREPRAVEVLKVLKRDTEWGKRPLPSHHGRGIAIGVHPIMGGNTSVRLIFDRTGSITVVTGAPDQGAGTHTMIQRVVAAGLSVSPERVRVKHRSTAQAPYDSGAGASRVTHITSHAAWLGARQLKDRIEVAATRTFSEPTRQVRLVADSLSGHDGEPIALSDAAPALCGTGEIRAEGTYDSTVHGRGRQSEHSFFGYVAEVAVDAETGRISVLKMTLAADVGAVINPVAHQGQIDGGFSFGVGTALMEELEVEAGRVATLNLGDYKLPTSMDIPPLRTILLPAQRGPGLFGAKMVGELANAAVAPAIANAVADAVGVRIFTLPLTAERIHTAIHAQGGAARQTDAPPTAGPVNAKTPHP